MILLIQGLLWSFGCLRRVVAVSLAVGLGLGLAFAFALIIAGSFVMGLAIGFAVHGVLVDDVIMRGVRELMVVIGLLRTAMMRMIFNG